MSEESIKSPNTSDISFPPELVDGYPLKEVFL